MEATENKGFVYEFGKFILDPREKTLYSDGVPVHLAAKEFETLLLLVEHNGKALSKDAMMAAIWQDAFVEESNLAKQISRLRKIFNNKDEQFIETLPKHGYRFSADMSATTAPVDDPVVIEKRTVKRVTVAYDNGKKLRASQLQLPPPRWTFRAWRWVVAAAAIVTIGSVGLWFWFRSTAGDEKRISTIAVLPLRPLSGDEGERTLALGLTDALITKLGSLKHLAIRPLGSVAGFSEGAVDPLEAGRRLNVDAVLEGSIQHSDGRLRVNARLLNTATGEQIWGDKFDDNLTNMFEVQDHISETAARALTATLAGVSGERLTKRYTESPAAFDAFIKGRYYWNKRTEPDFRRAVEYFDQAVAIDPNYALAYAGLADTYILLAVWGTEPPNISLPKAKDAAQKALAADADLAEAHTSLAFIDWIYDWDFAAADHEFDVALQLNPNYATAHHWRSYYLVSMGRNDQAIDSIKRARELEGPLSLGIMTDVGEIYCWAGRYDEAVEQLSDIIQREPQYAIAHYVLGITYLKDNMPINAIDELERARELEDSPRIASALAYAYGAAGEIDKARQVIAELQNISAYRYVSPFSLAIAYAGIGDDTTAMDRLEDAYTERSDAMAILVTHPLLTKLHTNPRFIDLASKVGFTKGP